MLWRDRPEEGSQVRPRLLLTLLLLTHVLQNLTAFETVSSHLWVMAIMAYACHRLPPHRNRAHQAKREAPTLRPAPVALAILASVGVGAAYYSLVQQPRAVAKSFRALFSDPLDADWMEAYRLLSLATPMGRHERRIYLAEVVMERLFTRDETQAQGRNHIESEVDFALAELQASLAACPTQGRVLHALGQLNALASYHIEERAPDYLDAAEQAFRQLLEHCPRQVLVRGDLARLLVYKGHLLEDPGQFQLALEQAERAVEIEPRLFASHHLVVEIAADALEQPETALEKINRAAAIQESWRRPLMRLLPTGE